MTIKLQEVVSLAGSITRAPCYRHPEAARLACLVVSDIGINT